MLSLVLTACAAAPQPGLPNVTLTWHDAFVDHFSFADARTFKQRVFTYDAHWSPGGPILFYTGNEANVELYVNATGLMWENAASLGAMLVWAEHRYYGESLPLGSSSSANATTLRFLTMEQALADYAQLIHTLKATRPGAGGSAVVAIGGSYGGMLAAWLRLHYPTAVVGAVAGSAPVLAFDGLLGPRGAATWDGSSYWRVVTRDATVAAGSVAGCEPGVRATWPALFETAASPEGREALSSTFQLCEPLPEAGGADRLAGYLLNVWDTLAMGNFPYASNYLVFQQTQDPSVKLPPWPFRVACSHYDGAHPTDPAAALLSRMARAASVLYNASGRVGCNVLPKDVNYDGIWDYQWCTERLPQETYFSMDGVRDMFWSRPQNQSEIDAHCMRKHGGGRSDLA